MHFLAKPAVGANAKGITHKHHPQHQLRIDRGAACMAVVGSKRQANAVEAQDLVELP